MFNDYFLRIRRVGQKSHCWRLNWKNWPERMHTDRGIKKEKNK
jgi:hypothetical protein